MKKFALACLGSKDMTLNNLKDSKPQSNHNITSSLFHLLTEDLDLFGEIAPLHVAAHFGASDDSEDKESDESEKKPTVKKRRRSYVEVKNAIQVKMFLKPLVQEKDTFTEQGENEIGFDSHESENNIQVEHSKCYNKNDTLGNANTEGVDFLMEKSKRKRKPRKIIYFNPPFSKSVKTNVIKLFLSMIDKHFPKGHKLHKCFNRNTVKATYCLVSLV